MTSLDLGNDGIGDQGAERLAAALETNSTLTSLHLGKNRIGARGAKRFAAALETNVSVTSLNLQNFRGDPTGGYFDLVQALVKKNKYGVRVATVHCSQNAGRDGVWASCTDLGGNNIASFELATSAPLTDLISSLSSQTTHKGRWRLALPDGSFLAEGAHIAVGDLLCGERASKRQRR